MVRLELLLLRFPWVSLLVFTIPALYVPFVAPALLIGAAALAVWGLGTSRVHPHRGWFVVGAVVAGLLMVVWSQPKGTDSPEPRGRGELFVDSGRGVVAAEASLTSSGESRFLVRLTQVEAQEGGAWVGRTLTVRGFRGSGPAQGALVSWTGRCEGSELQIKRLTVVGYEAPWWQWRATLRTQFPLVYTSWDAECAGLAEALVLGAVDDLTAAEKRSFRNAGCSHVLALSGMHLSLLALALGSVLRRHVDPVVAVGLTQAALALFCFLAGPIPSLYRAWVMALVVDFAALSQVRWNLLELLAASFLATVLLWPSMATTLSLQLSFLSLAGLALWSRWWEWSLRPWLGRWAAATLGAGLAAWMATAALTAWQFGEVRWVGIAASIPLVLLTNGYLGLSVVALAIAPWGGSELLAPVMSGLYHAIFFTTGLAGRVPALTGDLVLPVVVVVALGTFVGILYNMWPRGPTLPVSLNYDSPKDLQAFLDDRGFNALKRWGQNFLINPGARKQILDGLELTPGERVWEIGPGLGALTHHLVAQGHPTTVFEIDPGYCDFLRNEFGGASAGFALHEGDVIKTWRAVAAAGDGSAVKCVGNLPYNAASAIIADFIEGGFFPAVFVVTVQKEMADRMTASVGTKNYSSFSVLCQSVFRLFDVVVLRPGSFYPAPEVTSRVVKLVPHGLLPGLDHRRFSTFVRECFSSRRKTLRNNVPGAAAALRLSDDTLRNAFVSQGIDLGRRAETLGVEEFLRVYASTDQASTSPS